MVESEKPIHNFKQLNKVMEKLPATAYTMLLLLSYGDSMREAQIEYFRTKSQTWLAAAKKWESKYDALRKGINRGDLETIKQTTERANEVLEIWEKAHSMEGIAVPGIGLS